MLGVFVEMTEFDRAQRRFLANTALTGFGLIVMQCPICGCALAPARPAGAKAG